MEENGLGLFHDFDISFMGVDFDSVDFVLREVNAIEAMVQFRFGRGGCRFCSQGEILGLSQLGQLTGGGLIADFEIAKPLRFAADAEESKEKS